MLLGLRADLVYVGDKEMSAVFVETAMQQARRRQVEFLSVE